MKKSISAGNLAGSERVLKVGLNLSLLNLLGPRATKMKGLRAERKRELMKESQQSWR